MKVKEGQRVTGKLQTSMKFGMRPVLMFPHGTVTEVKGNQFKVKYEGIMGEITYRENDIDRTVYLKEELPGNVEEELDYEMEKQRLGIEE